jgi:hypothetical protein
MNLKTDPDRENREQFHNATGIYVRAQDSHGGWGSFDIAELSPESLTDLMKRDGGNNPMAENMVRCLLGHPQKTP